MATSTPSPKSKSPVPSETLRERETFKYYDLSSARAIHEKHPKSFEASGQPSKDAALTAFAQLGALRLGARRTMISLFDRKYQYVIAEATKSLSLQKNTVHDEEDKLWICGSAIPRKDTLCDEVLRSMGELQEDDHAGLPIFVIPDLCQEPREGAKWILSLKPCMRFYAAVPIRTPAGVNIGVYSVFDDKPRSSLDEASMQFLRDVSITVMKHLEMGRSKQLSRRGERMVRGLGSFVEGKSTITGWPESSRASFTEKVPDDEGALNQKQQQMIKDSETRELVNLSSSAHRGSAPIAWAHFQHHGWEASTSMVDTPIPFAPRRSSLPHSRGHFSHTKAASITSNSDIFVPMDLDSGSPVPSRNGSIVSTEFPYASLSSVFSRAANIIRESIEVEGVVFFDACIPWTGGLTNGHSTSQMSLSAAELAQQSSDEISSDPRVPSIPLGTCKALGFSTSMISSVNEDNYEPGDFLLQEDRLKLLLRRYSAGRIFNFDEFELMSSDNDDTENKGCTRLADSSTTNVVGGQDLRKRKDSLCSQKTDGQAIIELLPGARSVILFPQWDSHRERWFSAGMAWTRKPNRIFTHRDDLSYLMAFSTAIMAEIARNDMLKANKSKGNVLGSISHELRTPLHGILGGIDMLHNTKIDALQGDIAHTIETCGVTLLDTINHLLDQAKINNIVRDARRRQGSTGGLPSLISELEIDVLTEEVIESVYAGHMYQKHALMGVQRGGERPTPVPVLYHAPRTDPMQDEPAPWNITPPLAASVKIILDIDPTSDWLFYADPGSIRRILMNVFGNALKYTDRGYVKVTLREEELPIEDGVCRSNILLTVADSGKGISEEYLRTRLYKPFSQEDQLAPGVGLGLSITRQIVAHLKGSLQIESKVGKGTTASISFPLEKVDLPPGTPSPMERDGETSAHVNRLSGLRVRLHGFSPNAELSRRDSLSPDHDWQLPLDLIEKFCRDWLRMELVSSDDSETIPDIYVSTEAGAQELALANIAAHILQPIVVVCSSMSSASSLSSSINSATQSNVFEFISQPCSPRKLAKALAHSFDRWIKNQMVDLKEREKRNSVDLPSIPEHIDESSQISSVMTGEVRSRSRSSSCRSNFSLPVLDEIPAIEEQVIDDRPTYLLVDDNSVNLQLLIAYVKKRKCHYITAMDGLQAYKAYKKAQGKFRYVLMDISMPVMDGLESTCKIREYEQNQGLEPAIIIALTGLASAESQQEAFASGVDHFLTKPVRLKELDKLMQA